MQVASASADSVAEDFQDFLLCQEPVLLLRRALPDHSSGQEGEQLWIEPLTVLSCLGTLSCKLQNCWH